MIYRQLLTIIYQNENYITYNKIEHPSLCGEGCYLFIFCLSLIRLLLKLINLLLLVEVITQLE